MKPRACVDCKWHREVKIGEMGPVHKCESPLNTVLDLVTGLATVMASNCWAAREIQSGCGRDAKWFEPKDEIEALNQAVWL